MATEWRAFRESLHLTPEEEAAVNLEKSLVAAAIDAREKHGVAQQQRSELRGVQPSVIAQFDRTACSPQMDASF